MLGELTQDEIESLLYHEPIGRIGCATDGRVYVVPISFAYDGKAVYGHSREGRKIAMMRANPNVCFEVEHVDELNRWRSVILWGQYEELDGEQADWAMALLSDRLMPALEQHDTHGAQHEGRLHLEPVVYRITVREKSGRYETP